MRNRGSSGCTKPATCTKGSTSAAIAGKSVTAYTLAPDDEDEVFSDWQLDWHALLFATSPGSWPAS